MNIDDGLLLAAKAHASSHGRNVSDIVRELLAREVGWPAPCVPDAIDDSTARPVLSAYSEGRMSRSQAMESLALTPDRGVEFVEAMNRLSLAWPQADRRQIEREADIVVEAIRRSADDAD